MPCPRFEKEGYLFLSGELDFKEREAFETHFSRCSQCRETLEEVKIAWRRIEKLSALAPKKSVKKMILKASRRPKEKISPVGRLFTNPRLAWGLSAVVVTVVLVLIVVGPLSNHLFRQTSQSSRLSWDDDFYAQADWIDQEIDRVNSGALLTNYFSSAENGPSDIFDSVVSPDLDRIKDKVADLAKTIYGI